MQVANLDFSFYICLSSRSSTPSGTIAPAVPPPCATPFKYDFGDCMIELGGLSHLLSVRGSKRSNPRIFAVAPPWGIHSEYHLAGVKPFQPDYSFIFLTPAGNSPSERPANPLDISVTNGAQELEQLRQFLKLDKMHVQGHSAGGSIALLYAEEYPNRVASLTLQEACMEDYDDSATFSEFLTNWSNDTRYQDAISALPALVNVSDPGYPKTDAEFASALGTILPLYFSEPQTYGKLLAQELSGESRLPDLYANTQNTISIGSGIMAPNFAKLANVQAPTLVVVGQNDMFCSEKVAKIMHQGISSSELHVFSDSGHLPWYEKSSEYYSVVGAFWKKHVRAQGY
ncbi:hypothetical protein NQ176_g5520 [Zarea fungicola]|uniref:Uncharacterized protein n=1 Tax=Zarea fungicola TaxID=93591 RepID=A0ACC1N849_9HYPO|nr:hypothetical protein NQ176_g5520 [Lecanicillium fungicola]